ncbi:uncharacterized protein LOC124257989 [Haliotis rubra]|uniref:uncharacterized protein LOC124257989 n=1 Tax=Haliotis rubra TaxID=36100 RepID=UPI001EE51442|nr:uncharacterized protein LOC124257989 [Haliotis rubra]
MERRQRLNVANGVISGVVILCGIIYAALTGSFRIANFSTHVWGYCFAHITSGICGIVAAAIKRTGLYITHLVLSILALCVMAYVTYLFAFSAIGLCFSRCDWTAIVIMIILIHACLLTLANCIVSGILSQDPSPIPTQQVPQIATVEMSSTRHVTPQYVTPQGTYLPPDGAYMTYMTPEGGYVTPSDPPLPQHHDPPTPQYNDEPPPYS